jgi:murein DD-endopeptidase MepM/ murein hydrolase activator NlpD
MPEVRVDSAVFRRWRLPALLTGITLVGGAAMVRSTVARLHDQICEVRRLRARVAERRREIDRRCQELAAASATAGPVLDDAFAVRAVLASEPTREARSVPTLWPVRGTISSPFGWRRSPYGGGPEWHPGVDILAAYGTPVRATAAGEVVFAGRARGYGALVVLDHGAATTRYAHLSAIWVRVGQRVPRGESLGALGGTGRATAPHLHYEVRIGNEALDPECLLSRPARATLAGNDRPSATCALARARFEDRRPQATAPDPSHATTPGPGVAG